MSTNNTHSLWSLMGQLLGLCLLLILIALLLNMGIMALNDHVLFFPPWLVMIITMLCMVPIAAIIVRQAYLPVQKRLQALIDGVHNLSENDFSTSIAKQKHDEIGSVIDAFNRVSEVLRNERQNIFQRELLLDTVLQAAPLAIVLTDLNQRIIYANPDARHLFLAGHKLEGYNFDKILQHTPATLRDAVINRRQGLVSVEQADKQGEVEIYHLSCQHFVLNARDHELWLFKPMTRELNRQEVATWKKVIRVISHELNNSLAPIASLANSGLSLSKQQSDSSIDNSKLELIFNTIGERSRHLHSFIEAYARFARLPLPRKQIVEWSRFLAQVKETQTFQLLGDIPEQAGYFDPTQLEQALINLLKNAHESGSATTQVCLSIMQDQSGTRLRVMDRGSGINPTVMANAVLPFYSTKKSGSGLGLSLCREIMEAHEGRMAITNRSNGGTCVSLWLPAAPMQKNGDRINNQSNANKQTGSVAQAGHGTEPDQASTVK